MKSLGNSSWTLFFCLRNLNRAHWRSGMDRLDLSHGMCMCLLHISHVTAGVNSDG